MGETKKELSSQIQKTIENPITAKKSNIEKKNLEEVFTSMDKVLEKNQISPQEDTLENKIIKKRKNIIQ